MIKIEEVIVVEGKYDKNALRTITDAAIIETSGFGIFKDPLKLKLLRRLADYRGVIILTDSDSAGFAIRNYLKGALPEDKVKHAYIPDIAGKEKRKRVSGKEGKLGVEGMNREALEKALKKAGVLLGSGKGSGAERQMITKADLFAAGLSGRAGSASARALLLKKLDLPEHLSSNALLDVLNIIMSREEFYAGFR